MPSMMEVIRDWFMDSRKAFQLRQPIGLVTPNEFGNPLMVDTHERKCRAEERRNTAMRIFSCSMIRSIIQNNSTQEAQFSRRFKDGSVQ